MANLKIGAVALLGAALLAVGAGCGGSNPDEAKTPADAPTVTNTEPGSNLETAAGGQTTGGGGGGGGGDTAAIDAGKSTFEGTCQSCHPADGSQAGVGPQLAGAGLAAAAIKTQIENGGGAMPGGLVSGTDLDNVVAFVVSIQ